MAYLIISAAVHHGLELAFQSLMLSPYRVPGSAQPGLIVYIAFGSVVAALVCLTAALAVALCRTTRVSGCLQTNILSNSLTPAHHVYGIFFLNVRYIILTSNALQAENTRVKDATSCNSHGKGAETTYDDVDAQGFQDSRPIPEEDEEHTYEEIDPKSIPIHLSSQQPQYESYLTPTEVRNEVYQAYLTPTEVRNEVYQAYLTPAEIKQEKGRP